MVSNGVNLVAEQRMDSNMNPQMIFQTQNLQFNCENSQERSEKLFSGPYYQSQSGVEFRRISYQNSPLGKSWNGEGGSTRTISGGDGEGSEGDEVDDEDDELDEEDEEDEVEVDEGNGVDEGSKHSDNNHGSSVNDIAEEIRPEKGNNILKPHYEFGSSSGGVLAKERSLAQCANNIRGSCTEQHNQQGRVGHYENVVTIAEPNGYFSQLLQLPKGPALGQKEIGGENNGCGFSGRKDVALSMGSGASLRAILSDPVTGTLMDDAMILPCGHSFGSGGIQHVTRTKACYTCSRSVSEDMVAPNLSLRSAVDAFRREEELQSHRVSKRRKERFEQDTSNHGHSLSMDISRGRGVQFPFVVTDRVIIKVRHRIKIEKEFQNQGNKRTPLRFVGREAVVTTQCLNGWYVVKTLDNAESVKLQYRSLAKVSDSPSSTLMSNKTTPNWL
ncbi:hypothetical protein GIB67_041108 [Kingdonia uniflora]|uniref:U-box domain-containing protein n=1 Tax=Kingdonia uniflora TaxID=39325 RepID=A0A7J7LKH7_9MAGN|nr:hypothetical protein GIB67_041108 [Kingdonia uniflora]